MVLSAPALSIDVAPRSHHFDARVFDCSNPRCYLLYAVTGTLEVVDVVQGVPVGGVVQAGSPGDADRTVVFRVVVDETSPDALPNVFVLGPAISGTGVIPDVGADLTGHFGIGGAGFIGPVGIGETSDPFFVSFPSLEPGDELLAGVGLPVQGDELGSFVAEATACDDGLDNDNDGRTDDADLGCYDPRSTTERPRCQDGLDNDNATGIDFDGGASLDLDRDGRIDAVFNPAMRAVWIADPQCFGAPWRNTERPGCGVGFEIALIAPLLATLAGKRRVVEHGRAIRGIKKAVRAPEEQRSVARRLLSSAMVRALQCSPRDTHRVFKGCPLGSLADFPHVELTGGLRGEGLVVRGNDQAFAEPYPRRRRPTAARPVRPSATSENVPGSGTGSE